FMMFLGIFSSSTISQHLVSQYYLVYTVLAGICIILAAIYILNMIRRVFYGNNMTLTVAKDISINEKIVLGIIVILIFWLGIYPNSVLHLTDRISYDILSRSDVSELLKK